MWRTAALAALLLAGCREGAVKIDPPPKVVQVTVDRYVDLPADLTRDCYNEAAKRQTYGEAKRLANLRDESIAECNKRWAKVRALQDKAVDK